MDVEFTIKARNEAGNALETVFQDMDRTRRGAIEFGQAFGQLNPILAQTIFTVSDFTRATHGVDIGLRTSVIAVGLLTAGFAAYARALETSTLAQVAFNQALRSADIGALRGQLATVNTELDTMAAKFESLGSNRGFGQAFRNVTHLITSAPGTLLELLGFAQAPEERRRQIEQALMPLLQVQGQRESAEAQAARIGAAMPGLSLEQQRQALYGTTVGYVGAGLGIEASAVAQLTQQMEALRVAEQQEIAQAMTRPGGQLEAGNIRQRYEDRRALLRQQAESARRARAFAQEQFLSERGVAGLGLNVEEFAGFEGAWFGGETSEDRLRRLQIRTRQEAQATEDLRRELIQDIAPLEGFEGAWFGGLTPGERREGARRASVGRQEAVSLEADRLTIARERVALTANERAGLDLILIQQRQLVELEQAGGDEQKEALANFRAQTETAAKLREEFERTDFLGGMAKELREVSENLTSFGEAGADAMRRFASTAERTLSDLFFLPVQQGFKKTFEELPRQVGLSALRILTDTFARISLGSLLRGTGLGGVAALGGLVPGGAGGGAFTVTGASAEQLAQLQSAGYQVLTSQAGQTVAVPAQQAGFGYTNLPYGWGAQQAYGQLAPSYLQALMRTPISDIWTYGLSTSVAAQQAGMTASELALAGEASALGVGASYGISATATEAAALGVGASYGTTTAGTTVGNLAGYAGYAGAVVAAGYTAYAAYQSGSPGYGAAQGAMTGMMIGTMISPGWGTVIGLVVGAALGAGLGALGKNAPSRMQREQLEAGRAQGVAQQMISEINVTQTLGDLYELLVSWGSGATGGTHVYAIITTVTVPGRGSVMIGRPNGTYPTASLEEFAANFETVGANIQAGVFHSLLDDANRAIEWAIKQRARQLFGEAAQVLFGFDQALTVKGLGAVTRTTILPASRAGEAEVKGRGPLMLLGESLLGLDDDTKARLLYELARVNDEMDLQILRVEENGVRVTVGRYTRPASRPVSTVGTTPATGAATAPPPQYAWAGTQWQYAASLAEPGVYPPPL